MQNTNYVFLNAVDAAIVVTVNNTVVATDVQTADALVQVFLTHNINVLTDTIMCSSSTYNIASAVIVALGSFVVRWHSKCSARFHLWKRILGFDCVALAWYSSFENFKHCC